MGKLKPRVLGNALRGMEILLGAAGLVMIVLALNGWFDTGDQTAFRTAILCCAPLCYVALALFWRVAGNIARDNSFCAENVRLMRRIGWLAFAETLAVTVAGAVLMATRFLGTRMLPFLGAIIVMGLCIGVASLALSQLVERARVIKEENDFTV